MLCVKPQQQHAEDTAVSGGELGSIQRRQWSRLRTRLNANVAMNADNENSPTATTTRRESWTSLRLQTTSTATAKHFDAFVAVTTTMSVLLSAVLTTLPNHTIAVTSTPYRCTMMPASTTEKAHSVPMEMASASASRPMRNAISAVMTPVMMAPHDGTACLFSLRKIGNSRPSVPHWTTPPHQPIGRRVRSSDC